MSLSVHLLWYLLGKCLFYKDKGGPHPDLAQGCCTSSPVLLRAWGGEAQWRQ